MEYMEQKMDELIEAGLHMEADLHAEAEMKPKTGQYVFENQDSSNGVIFKTR